jgi:hypothetical protein
MKCNTPLPLFFREAANRYGHDHCIISGKNDVDKHDVEKYEEENTGNT